MISSPLSKHGPHRLAGHTCLRRAGGKVGPWLVWETGIAEGRSRAAALVVGSELAIPIDKSSRPENRSSGKGPLHMPPTERQALAV